MEQHRAEPPSAHPCRVCVCQWLLQHNGLKVRLARELNETNSTDQQHPEATARIDGMTATLLSAPGVKDAAIPAERPVPAALRRAAGLPKHRRPNNAVELRIQTTDTVAAKKLTQVARETATVKGRLGKKQNEMQRRDSRKNKRKHDNSRRNKKQKVEQTRQEKMRRILEACVTDENATEVSGLYKQWWKGDFKTETMEFGPTKNTD